MEPKKEDRVRLTLVPNWDMSTMRIIALSQLKKYQQQYPLAERQLALWAGFVSKASWSTPQDIKDSFRSASFIENNRVVFNICGNNYRLVVAVAYQIQAVYVKFFGTHAEYDNINAATIEVK